MPIPRENSHPIEPINQIVKARLTSRAIHHILPAGPNNGSAIAWVISTSLARSDAIQRRGAASAESSTEVMSPPRRVQGRGCEHRPDMSCAAASRDGRAAHSDADRLFAD